MNREKENKKLGESRSPLVPFVREHGKKRKEQKSFYGLHDEKWWEMNWLETRQLGKNSKTTTNQINNWKILALKMS